MSDLTEFATISDPMARHIDIKSIIQQIKYPLIHNESCLRLSENGNNEESTPVSLPTTAIYFYGLYKIPPSIEVLTVMRSPDTADVLDALAGVSYWTDLEGYLRGGGVRNWNAFAAENGAAEFRLESLIGQNLFDFIQGDAVKEVYRTLHESVVLKRRPKVTFTYQCDSSDLARTMRMSLGPLHEDGAVTGVLYHSQVLTERHRPPLALLDYADAARQLMDDTAPIVGICSFCHLVSIDATRQEWVPPETYYREGGQSEVRLSHGICPNCTDRIAAGDTSTNGPGENRTPL